MKRSWFGSLILSCSLMAMPFAANAGRGHGHGGEGFMKAIEQLDLSADQKKKLKEIHAGTKGTLKPKRDAMKAAHEELKTAMQGTASDDELRKKFDVFKGARDEFMKARFEKVLAVRSILTPEQRLKFKGLRGPDRQDDED